MHSLERIPNEANIGLVNGPSARAISSAGTAISVLIVGVCVLVSSCKGSGEQIWSAEVRSPDGTMVASGRTYANSGLGTASIDTAVYLRQTNSPRSQGEAILGLSGGTEVPPSVSGVRMDWLTPTHLELTYAGGRTIEFQAVRCLGIDITVRALSSIDSSPLGLRRNVELGRQLGNGK